MNITDAVARRIDNYRPRCLTAEAWALARGAVTALVRAAAPTTPTHAICLASTLCTFLAAPSGWPRDSAPDLRVLLTDAAVETFAKRFRGPDRTRLNHVALLRTLQCAASRSVRVPDLQLPVRRRPSRQIAQVYAHCDALSLATVASVFAAHTGNPLTSDRLRGLVELLHDTYMANVTGRQTGTVLLDRAALGHYLGAADQQPMTEAVRAKTPRTKSPKPLSQRQQLEQDRADRAAYRRAQRGPRLSAHPDLDALEPAIRSAITRYRPRDLDDATWATLRPLTIQLVAGYNPPSVTAARNAATIVVRFLRWLWRQPNRPDTTAPPSALELLSSAVVDAYAAPAQGALQLDGVPAASRSTHRTVLRRCVRSLDTDHVDVPFTYTAVAPPYTPAECEEFVWLATSQPTAARERNACYLLGLSLGAGLGPGDLRGVRRCHITEILDPDRGTYLEVTVLGGRDSRTVPIRRQYEPLIRHALELSADGPTDALVLGQKETRRNVTINARRGIVTATVGEVITIEPNRLRTTWLFACMNADVPLADLLRLAGLRTARTLADLLVLCPPSDRGVVDRVVLAIQDAGVAVRPAGVAQ
jgi:hypothetical protein